MAQFKEGGIYVDDKTGAVYECLPRKNVCQGDKTLALYNIGGAIKYKNYPVPHEVIIHPQTRSKYMRPWQASDEPTSYDVERWGKVEIGKVYKNIRASKSRGCVSCLAYTLDGVAAYIMYWENRDKFEGDFYKNKEPIHKFNSLAHFSQDITRPAFPYEIEGLTLPEMEGVI
jgi:hypothetical protein